MLLLVVKKKRVGREQLTRLRSMLRKIEWSMCGMMQPTMRHEQHEINLDRSNVCLYNVLNGERS